MRIVYIWAMKKTIFLFLVFAFAANVQAQNCDKGCGKIIKTEHTTLKGIKPNRAVLIFKFQSPGGKPAQCNAKIIVDGKDTIRKLIDKTGITKLTTKPGVHKLKFMVDYWYSIKMNEVTVKADNTYTFLLRFEAKEIGAGGKSKDVD